MEYLELVIKDLEERVNKALSTLRTPEGDTVSLGVALYNVSAGALDTFKYKEEI